jgi:hypothetical protein
MSGMDRLIHKKDMRVTQTLASGTIIRQDFRTSARFVFFDTGNEDWQYATHGGTMFVVVYKGTPYGLTCRHVLKDFSWHQLVVTDQRQGRAVAGLGSIAYPSQPKDEAIDTDLLDVVVIQFSADVGVGFFKDAPYVIVSIRSGGRLSPQSPATAQSPGSLPMQEIARGFPGRSRSGICQLCPTSAPNSVLIPGLKWSRPCAGRAKSSAAPTLRSGK